MILHALYDYFANRVSIPPCYQEKEIPFLVILDKEGNFKDWQDTRYIDGRIKRSRVCVVPREVKRSGSKAWGKANLLWDTPAYVFGVSVKDQKTATKKHHTFISKFNTTFSDMKNDDGILAVASFLNRSDFNAAKKHPTWLDVLETDGYISFKLEGEEPLICESAATKEIVAKKREGKYKAICLVTGEKDEIATLHNVIKGVYGAQSTGANIVSFNLPAFESYDMKKGFNAQIGINAEFAYITSLNKLLSKDSRQRLLVGDSTAIFWAERENMMEQWFADFFGEAPKETSDQDIKEIRALFESLKNGTLPSLSDTTKFFVLGLAPNASRISIRFWYEGSVKEIAERIRQHYQDCEIIHGPKETDYLSLFRLLVSTAIQGKSDNIQANLAGDIIKAVLAGTPYPAHLLNMVLNRIKAEQSKKNSKTGKAERNVTYARAALIKAVLVRNARFYNRNEKEVGMSLDKSNNNPGYRLGRLFAVMEKTQANAAGGWDKLNSTIRDRFYGAASSTPSAVFPLLLRLKNHHISKIENRGTAMNLEKEIGEIMEGLSDFPSHLTLQDQGRFAVGYYHQRQDFFTKK